jgi:anti-sigma factor RsiW
MTAAREPDGCRDLVEAVTDYLEGTMAADERRRLERHLAGCEGCEDHLERMRGLVRVVGRPAVDAVPAGTLAGLLRAFQGRRR